MTPDHRGDDMSQPRTFGTVLLDTPRSHSAEADP